MKNKKIFITGTGTDIGKTYISGLLVKMLKEKGINVAYYKAAMSGNIRDEKGKLIPGDGKFVKDISGIDQALDSMCPYVYENAVSPHLASKIEGNPVNMDVVKEGFNKLINQYDFVLCEGSGGILCPINFDNKEIYLEDIIKEFEIPCIIVADAGLGTINNLVLTYEYMKSKGIQILGIIINNYHPGNIMEEDNIFMCQHMTGLKVIAKVKENDKKIEMEMEI